MSVNANLVYLAYNLVQCQIHSRSSQLWKEYVYSLELLDGSKPNLILFVLQGLDKLFALVAKINPYFLVALQT